MSDPITSVSRRQFLSGLAIAGAMPFWSKLDALAWMQAGGTFSGENLELAHRLLFDPEAILANGAPQDHPEPYDVVIVGGGIAGLVVAHRLNGKRVLLLEAAPEAGGVSKSETWQGIDYAIGAAYIIDPAADSEDARELAGFKLLEELGLRSKDEDLTSNRKLQRRLSGDANHCVFSNRRVVPDAEVYTLRNRRFFEHVLDSDDYPSVPPVDPALVEALDRVSFRRFLEDAPLQRKLYGRTVGVIRPLGWEAIEYYCWGAFGTTADETSAYHGLNFFAAEFGDVLVYPGGNGFITRRLAERIAGRDPQCIRTGHWALRIEREGTGQPATPGAGTFGITAWENETLHRFHSRAVVFAAPLFLAPKVIPRLPDAQRTAIASLAYRSYVVANVLLRRNANRIFANPAFRNGYELTRVHGVDARRVSAEQLSGQKVYSDAILADFASGRHPTHAVLTVYRPYPFAAGRSNVMNASFEAMETEIRREVLAGFGPHGLRAADIEGMRISRWGHPMIVARPGQLADGTMRAASQSQPGLYFAHTDIQGAPAYENALAAAFDAVEEIRKQLP